MNTKTSKNPGMHERLKLARKNAGFRSCSEVSRKFGWNPSRYRAHENGQNPFKVADAEAYASAFKCSAAWLLTGDAYFASASSPRSVNYVDGDGMIDPFHKLLVPHIGPACVGLWKEVDLVADPTPGKKRIAPIDPRFPANIQFDVEALGDALNKIAPEGSLLRCVDPRPISLDVNDGDFVVIERKNPQGMIEISARQVRKNGNLLELMTATDNPRLATQVIIHDKTSDKQDIKIIGKVLWTYNNL